MPERPAPQTCNCASPHFYMEDGDERCFICRKLRSSSGPPQSPEFKQAQTRSPKQTRESPNLSAEPKRFHSQPEAIWRAIEAARASLRAGDGFVVPDRIFNCFITEEGLAKEWQELTKDLTHDDAAQIKVAAETLMTSVRSRTTWLFIQSAREALAVFGSSPAALATVLKTPEELKEYELALGQAIAVGLQADYIRRQFGLSPAWPTEAAIIHGPDTVEEPFLGELPRSESKPLAQRLSRALFASDVQMLDGPQRVQVARDQFHEAIEQLFSQLKEQFGGTYPSTFVKADDGTFRQVDDPEVTLYQLAQEYCPEFIGQPLKTATPRQVMVQRLADARKRRAKRGLPHQRYSLKPPRDTSEENGKIPYSSLGTLSVE